MEQELCEQEDNAARNLVFLITFAAVLPDTADAQLGVPLRTLEGVTRANVRDAILDAVAHPVASLARVGGRPRTTTLSAVKLVVFEEQPKHFHVAIRLSAQTRFLPLKMAIRNRCGFATHWSTSHAQFWSAVRYGTFTTERKPVVDSSPLTWSATGESLNLFEEAQEPFNARALKQRREVKASVASAGDAKKAKLSFTKLDLNALIIAEGLRSAAAVVAHVKSKGSTEMQLFVARCQRRLPEFVSDAWEWDGAEATAKADGEDDWDLVKRLASEECSCQGHVCEWRAAAAEFFRNNKDSINEGQLAAATASIIQSGPTKTTRVPLLVGPTNAAKSTIFDPVDEIFGATSVFHTPSLGANMPLANLATKKKRFIYLDDYRPVEFATSTARLAPTIPVTTFLKLFGGQFTEVAVSQSFNNGHVDLCWKRGVVMTAKEEGLWDRAPGVSAEDVRHMKSRVVQFPAVFQVPCERLRDVRRCPTSWSRWLVEASAAAASGRVRRGLADPDDSDEEAVVELKCDFF